MKPAARNTSLTGKLLSSLSEMASLSRDMLKEVFDESAYARFLKRNDLQSSANAYAVFLKENEQVRSRRPRCC